MKAAKTWNVIGVLVGLCICIAGCVFYTNPAPSYFTYSTKDATFGGDYYTYQYEATQVVAKNTKATANTVMEMSAAQAQYYGTLFIVLGALTTLHYGKLCCVEENKPTTNETYVTENTYSDVPSDEAIYSDISSDETTPEN